MNEVRKMAADPEFTGVVSDIGGPTANMYQMRCTRPEVEAKCKRLSCVHPTICKLLGTDHGPLIDLLRRARTEPGIRKVLVASGMRMDLAQLSPEYLRELAEHHVGGHLKVAPEHTDPHVLGLMKKPDNDNFESFAEEFKQGVARRRQAEAVPRAVLHRQPSRIGPARDDRPGPVPEAQRLPARSGAGLHPGAVRHRHVHVLHRHRSVHEARGVRRPGTCGTARCSGR